MPEQKTSGQPMDTYAGTCGSSEFGNPAPSAVENVATPLTGSKGPENVPMFNGWAAAINDQTKGGDKSVPMFPANAGMQNTGGAHR